MRLIQFIFIFIFGFNLAVSQDYFLKNNGPYNNSIQSPEEYLGYEIGYEHTRHDLIVAYLKYLANVSEKAQILNYENNNNIYSFYFKSEFSRSTGLFP